MKFKDAIDFKDEIYERELRNEIVPEVVFSCNHLHSPECLLYVVCCKLFLYSL